MSGFIIYIFVSVFTPGPNNIFSSTSSLRVGFRKTLPFMFGVFVGTFIVFYITGVLNVFLYENVQVITQVIGILGGLFIIYLAVKMFLTSKQEDKMMITNNHYFLMAILLTLINPKALIFGLTVATYYLHLGFPTNGILLLSFLSAFLCFVSVVVWGMFGRVFRKFLSNYRVAFNIVMAVLLGYSGVLIIIESF